MMNKRYVHVIGIGILGIFGMIEAEQPVINIYHTSNNDVAATANTTQQQQTNNIIKQISVDLEKMTKDAATAAHRGSSDLAKWVFEHRWRAALCCAATSYAALRAYLWKLERKYEAEEMWFRWREVPLSALFSISDEQLVQELLIDIHERYFDADAGNRMPLNQFFGDLKAEHTLLTTYRWWAVFFTKHPYVRTVLCISVPSEQQITEQLQRLEYLKRKLKSWIALHRAVTAKALISGTNVQV